MRRLARAVAVVIVPTPLGEPKSGWRPGRERARDAVLSNMPKHAAGVARHRDSGGFLLRSKCSTNGLKRPQFAGVSAIFSDRWEDVFRGGWRRGFPGLRSQ